MGAKTERRKMTKPEGERKKKRDKEKKERNCILINPDLGVVRCPGCLKLEKGITQCKIPKKLAVELAQKI